MQRIVELPFDRWEAPDCGTAAGGLAGHLEQGKVLYLPRLAFLPGPGEIRFLDSAWLSGSHKSVSFDPDRSGKAAGLRGARGTDEELAALAGMMARFRGNAVTLIKALFPRYESHLRIAPTSLRPGDVEKHKLSWRKDDTLLHVDAFPSRPNRGERILRVFANVNPSGRARVWKIGDLFGDTAREFMPRIRRPVPGSATLLRALRVTKSRRSRYDHLMLGLHDQMKLDRTYQARTSHLTMPFPAGSTWICFSDQAAHAAIAGQFMMEQTFHLPLTAMYFPDLAPLRVLERLTGRALT